MSEVLKYVFDGLADSKRDLARLRKDPPPITPGHDDSGMLRMLEKSVHAMEINAIQLLQGTPPENNEIN